MYDKFELEYSSQEEMMTQVYSQDAAYKQKLLGNPTNDILARYLDSAGDGSGTKNMAAAADEYFLTPGSNLIYVVDHIRIAITDNVALDADGFGGLAALTAGCLFKVQSVDSVVADIVDLANGVPIASHGELSGLGRLSIIDEAAGCFVQCDMDLGAPIRLDGNRNERLLFETKAGAVNVSGLVSLYVFATGRIFKDLS